MADTEGTFISPEEAKAVQEVTKTAGKAIDAAESLARYFADRFDSVVRTGIGIAEDWLGHTRVRIRHRLAQRTAEILLERGIDPAKTDVSPNILTPIIAAAQDESRGELCELWARLLANAVDPGRQDVVTRSVVEALKALDPIDALILSRFYDLVSKGKAAGATGPINLTAVVAESCPTPDAGHVSIQHLSDLRLLRIEDPANLATRLRPTPLGRELVRAVSG